MSTFSSPAPLSAEQIETYYREGYLVVPCLVPGDEIDRVRAALPGLRGDEKNWTASTFDHDHPDTNPERHRLLVEPHIVAAVEQIFEAPARVYFGMTALVPAGGGRGLPWHQDNQYTRILGNALNVFVALGDIAPDQAILWIAPRSHWLGTQPARRSEEFGGHREAIVEPENGFPLPGLRKGDACIFNRNTYHRSLKNETGEHRYAYAAQYMAEYARLAETGAKDPRRMPVRDLRERWKGVL